MECVAVLEELDAILLRFLQLHRTTHRIEARVGDLEREELLLNDTFGFLLEFLTKLRSRLVDLGGVSR